MGNSNIDKVFVSWRDRLARLVSKIVPPGDIEDIVQETYVRACQYASETQVRTPRALMSRIAHNLALDHIKRADLRLVSYMGDMVDIEDDFVSPPMAEPDIQATSREEFALFCEAVRELPVQCRRVFVLKKVYGYSQKEIASALDISENTVEKHVAQGIKRCVLFMKQQTREVPLTRTGVQNPVSEDGAGQ